MDKEQIKVFLKDNPELIKKILEELGCNYIKIHNDRVSSTRPDGDNKGAISIKLNDSLSTSIFTRNDFQQSECKDFYTLIQYLTNKNFYDSLKLICKICNLEYTNRLTKQKKQSKSMEFLLQYKRMKNKENHLETFIEETLDESFIERFIKCSCQRFYDDGICDETQDKFGISYDTLLDRVVIPIRNEEGKLLTFKGRANNKEWKECGEPKYYYYYPYYGNRHLYGYYENYHDLLLAKEIYIGESEKFVLQLDTMGINNCLSISKKTFSEEQIKLLIKLGKPIVIMFDKDVSEEDIKIECRRFKGLLEIYYCLDDDNLLDKKDSPTDKGINVFNQILNHKYKFKE